MGIVLFPVLLAVWILALKGAGRIDRGPRALLALMMGGVYFAARALDVRGVPQTAALSSVAFALICFAILSLARDREGLAWWLLAIIVGTLLLFAGVPAMEARLNEIWWGSDRPTTPAGADENEGDESGGIHDGPHDGRMRSNRPWRRRSAPRQSAIAGRRPAARAIPRRPRASASRPCRRPRPPRRSS